MKTISTIDVRELRRASILVTILKVISPTYFWVRYQDQRDFNEMMEELQLRLRRRGNTLMMWPNQIKEGSTYAIQMDDGTWQRGILTGKLGNGNVTVALRDYGTTMFRKTHHIYRLEERFRHQPWQAILCSLAYIASSSLAPVWTERANLLMWLACEGKDGTVKIRGTKGDEVAFVDLTIKMEDDGDVQDIRTLLKSFGYAKDVPEINYVTQPSA